MMEEAHTRWLIPNEIHTLLYNCTLFSVISILELTETSTEGKLKILILVIINWENGNFGVRVYIMKTVTFLNVRKVNDCKISLFQESRNSGIILLFDRKMLRNFQKDRHNWKKKKDGKTIKEAHEHLKVGNEERIHVYYAHRDDNSSFVCRCYWLLDKKYEHIVLVHYCETSEMQSSPVTPVNSNSSSGHSGTSISKVLLEETDTAADHAFCLDSGTSSISEELCDNMTMKNHEKRLHEINTLEWEELLASADENNITAPGKRIASFYGTG